MLEKLAINQCLRSVSCVRRSMRFPSSRHQYDLLMPSLYPVPIEDRVPRDPALLGNVVWRRDHYFNDLSFVTHKRNLPCASSRYIREWGSLGGRKTCFPPTHPFQIPPRRAGPAPFLIAVGLSRLRSSWRAADGAVLRKVVTRPRLALRFRFCKGHANGPDIQRRSNRYSPVLGGREDLAPRS